MSIHASQAKDDVEDQGSLSHLWLTSRPIPGAAIHQLFLFRASECSEHTLKGVNDLI